MHKSASSLSLSQKLRSESSRVGLVSRQSDKDNEKNNQRGNSYYGKTLPTINSSISRIEMSKSLPEPFEHLSPAFRRNTMNRLAGLSDNVNSSGLFSENHFAKTISPLCVRCGVLAALCMSCAEQDTEDALTFYRKTRAAGAATLFNKAFIEAGFRKTLKFLVFRLLKNSVQAKIRERMKKKTIVEKLFGTNLVYLPFNAWRRYTKENIVRRKNRSIEQLTSQIEVLETQIRKLSVNLTEVNRENEQLKATIVKQKSIIEAQTEKITLLEDDNKHQRERVKGLSHLVIPLINYSNALESITQQKIVETNRYLQKAATLTTSYNYNHLFEESLFEQLYHKVNNEKKRKETYAPKLTNINLPSKQLQTGHQIALTWLNSISLQAGEYIESASGQSLNRYLPQHNPVETINDLRNGKLLCRVIVTLIFDRYQLRKQAENGIININSCYYQLWNKNIITLEDIEKIRSLQSHTLELLQFLISLTVIYLEMPAFKAMEIFSGKTDVIYSFVVCLMNASIPMVNKAEKDYFEKKISIYYQIVNQIEELKQEKVASLTTVFHDEKKLLKEKEKAKEFAPLPSQPFTPTPLATTTITEGGESKDEEEDEREGKDMIEAKESILDEGEGDGEESVEIKAKSLLEQLYEFFVYENSLKASQLQSERQEQFQKAISASESVDDVQRNDAKVVSDSSVTLKEVTLDSAGDSSRNVSSNHNKPFKPQDLKLDSVDRAESIDPNTVQSERRSNPLDDTDETASLSALMATRLPKVQYSLDMSNESYDQLCKLLDEFIVSPESSRILEISEKSFVISEKLAELQSAITLIRDHRDEGIRLTTDIRQFVVTHAMKLTYRNTES